MLPPQQPKTRSAYAARGRYGVLGSIYYDHLQIILQLMIAIFSVHEIYPPLQMIQPVRLFGTPEYIFFL